MSNVSTMSRTPEQPATTTPAAPVEVFWVSLLPVNPTNRDGRKLAILLKRLGRQYGLECTDFGSFTVPTAKEARTCRSVAMVRNGGQHNDDGNQCKGNAT